MNAVMSTDVVNMFEFGFKQSHSTNLYTQELITVVDYYLRRESDVYACFIDFSKVFDPVNYYKLFNMLLEGVNTCVVNILLFLYSMQDVRVRWLNAESNCFSVANGTRQGDNLSPYLFSRYVGELIKNIVNCKAGSNIGGIFYNKLAYVDDMVLLSPS